MISSEELAAELAKLAKGLAGSIFTHSVQVGVIVIGCTVYAAAHRIPLANIARVLREAATMLEKLPDPTTGTTPAEKTSIAWKD